MRNYPKISVIVPTYNAEKTILQCIESLLNQTYLNYEIIIVDGNSSDSTLKIIRRHKKIIYLSEKKKGPAAARNTGIRFSKGKLIVFTDSDCVVKIDWLERLTKPIRSGECQVTMGGTLSATDGKLEKVEQNAYEMYLRNIMRGIDLETIDTRNFALTKRILETETLFDEKLFFAEDYHLGLKLKQMGYKLLFVDGVEVCHFHKTSFDKIFKTKFLQNYWSTYVYKKEGLASKAFKLNYNMSILALISLIALTMRIIFEGRIYFHWAIVPLFFLISSIELLRNIMKFDFYSAKYHLLSVVAVRLGIIKYLIDSLYKI